MSGKDSPAPEKGARQKWDWTLPTRLPYKSAYIGPGLEGAYCRVKNLQPSQLVINSEKRDKVKLGKRLDVYMLAWTSLLIVFWGLGAWARPHSLPLACVFMALAFWRWSEIVGAGIELASRKLRTDPDDPISALALVLLYGVQLILIVTVYVQGFLAAGWSVYPDDMKSPHQWHDALFLSWRIVTSFGGGLSLSTGPAQALAVVGGATGLLLVALFVAYGVGQLAEQPSPSPCRAPEPAEGDEGSCRYRR